MISPHGGKLINRIVSQDEKQEILNRVKDSKTLRLDREKIREVKNIASGVFSPLSGFLRERDFQNVLIKLRLADGTLWPLPVVLDISPEQEREIKNEKRIILADLEGKPLAVLEDFEIYDYDKDQFADSVFGTKDINHPGVKSLSLMKDRLVGGDIKLLDEKEDLFPEYNLTPGQTRRIFQDKGWRTVAAFQTRNVPHRGHEFLQRQALSQADGLMIQPVIGEKKLADFKDEFILGSYGILIDKYLPKERVVLTILPLKMRYAGPREALLHALVRKNFGCSHFIVGRDHAGVGNYYGPYAAQEIFNDFKQDEIGINILKYENVVWCQKCQSHVFENACPHNQEDKLCFSGTKIREKIKSKEELPSYFIRPEIHQLLLHSFNPLVDERYNDKSRLNQRGFVLWFTGLSGAGKSTLADKIYENLKSRGTLTERLDGDIVRQFLSKELGFSKEHRDENIKRVGLVSKYLSKNGFAVLASFISPYRQQRENLRKEVENFIEVFCKCPLDVCEKRDIKGLYGKARRGEIENFTGISDPYETPVTPEIVVETDRETPEQSAEKIMDYLKTNGYL